MPTRSSPPPTSPPAPRMRCPTPRCSTSAPPTPAPTPARRWSTPGTARMRILTPPRCGRPSPALSRSWPPAGSPPTRRVPRAPRDRHRRSRSPGPVVARYRPALLARGRGRLGGVHDAAQTHAGAEPVGGDLQLLVQAVQVLAPAERVSGAAPVAHRGAQLLAGQYLLADLVHVGQAGQHLGRGHEAPDGSLGRNVLGLGEGRGDVLGPDVCGGGRPAHGEPGPGPAHGSARGAGGS